MLKKFVVFDWKPKASQVKGLDKKCTLNKQLVKDIDKFL